MTTLSPRFLACMPAMLPEEDPDAANWNDPKNYSDTPGDPGAETFNGITQATYDHWRVVNGLPRQPVRLCTKGDGYQLYFAEYWLPYCPELPAGLDLMFFDTSVNQGVRRAVQILQYALGYIPDGIWGPITDAAVKAITNVPIVISAFGARRAIVYRQTENFNLFGEDWEARDTRITASSLTMAA